MTKNTKAPPPLSSAGTTGASAAIRMYCHGLGDCFLLRFTNSQDGKPYFVLIDCGVIGIAKNPRPLMEEVASNIRDSCNGHLDLVILTHEHWDHVSGFSEQQARSIFDQIQIDQVWYAWTEDPSPKNKLGNKLRREREAKLQALQHATVALQQQGNLAATERAQRIQSLLSFFGDDANSSPGTLAAADTGGIGKTRAAFDYLSKRSGVKVRYCHPKDSPVTIAGGAIRTYVLSPPENEALIKRSAPTKSGKETYEMASQLIDAQIETAFERLAGRAERDDQHSPFEASYRFILPGDGFEPAPLLNLKAKIWDPVDWRKIDLDWTAVAESLALNLDQHTNNTSLVIAFEIVATKQVLLFAADAQVGNWLSWQDASWQTDAPHGQATNVTGPDLLSRTVFYKVGHHGSHNATLKELGLEQMTDKNLIAFVPVDKAQAETNRWLRIPFAPLMERLQEKTSGRVIRADETSLPKSLKGTAQTTHTLRQNSEHEPRFWELLIP